MYQYKREPLSDDEVNALINACKTSMDQVAVITMLDTGVRVSELSSLTKENMLWQEKRIMVYGKGGPYGKMSKRRIIPMTDRVYTVLSSWFTLNDTIGIEVRTLQYYVKKVARKAKIIKKVSPHVLRHTFAVNCIKKGISLRTLQYLLGHGTLATTECYLNLSPEDAISEFNQKF